MVTAAVGSTASWPRVAAVLQLILTVARLHCAAGGFAFPTANLSDTTYPFRQNWCGLRRQWNTSAVKDLYSILKGRTVTFAIDLKVLGDAPFMVCNLTSGVPIAGQTLEILTELSSRMGFKIQYVMVPYPFTNSYSAYLAGAVKYTDVYVTDVFSDTADRRDLNVGRLPPLGIDAIELVAVSQKLSITSTLGVQLLWQFLVPFSYPLWGIVVACCFFNGVLMWLYSTGDKKFYSPGDDKSLGYFVFRSMNGFAGVWFACDFMLVVVSSSSPCGHTPARQARESRTMRTYPAW